MLTIFVQLLVICAGLFSPCPVAVDCIGVVGFQPKGHDLTMLLPRSSPSHTKTTPASNAVIDAFATQVLQTFIRNPEWTKAFNVDNYPVIEVGKTLKKILFKRLEGSGCPDPSGIAQKGYTNCVNNFEDLGAIQYPILIGRVYGTILLNRGLLTPDNLPFAANAVAVEIWNFTKKLKPSDLNGYMSVIVNGCEGFFNRFGLKFPDIALEVTNGYERETLCLSKGICH